jgi:hypothetical protein
MSVGGFLSLVFGSFFRWWWAVVTGVLSLLSWVFVPQGVELSRVAVTTLTVVWLALFFLCVSVSYQSWLLYRDRWTSAEVLGCLASDSYGGEFVFLIKVEGPIGRGELAELRRYVSGVEVPIALVELMERNSRGQVQARPVWLSPGHLRDLRMGTFLATDLAVDRKIQLRTLRVAKDGLAQMESLA